MVAEVKVPKQIEDLVPGFLENRHKDAEILRAALAGGHLETLRQIGHRLKGVGASYGFEQISIAGKAIEQAAVNDDAAALAELIDDYSRYLCQLHVTYE